MHNGNEQIAREKRGQLLLCDAFASHATQQRRGQPFDGYGEKPARGSSTCLVSVARNRYSVPCELAGQMVSTRLYPGSVVVVADDAMVARHERLSNAGDTCYDWQHYMVTVY